MNDDIIKLAREAGFNKNELAYLGDNFTRFAALVIKPWADQLEVERKKFQELNDVAALGMQHARADEREACAKVCEEMRPSKAEYDQRFYDGCTFSAAAIRARGNT